MKKTFIIIFAVLIFALCGCQPTPDKEIVISRENTEQEVIKSAEQNKDAEQINFDYQVPEHVSQRYNIVENKLDMVIDADVDMPKLDRVSVAKITSDPFTQKRADGLREYFMQDGILVNEEVFIKADYDEMIVRAKLEYEERESDEPIYMDGVEWIEYLLEERGKAPDEYIPEEISNHSIFQEDGLRGRIVVGEKEIGHLRIAENTFWYRSVDRYRIAFDKFYDENDNVIKAPQKEIHFTIEAAEDIVLGYFTQMGIDNMALAETEKVYFYEGDNSCGEIKYGGYEMTFVREFGGMITMIDKGYRMGKDDKYGVSPPIKKEVMKITIDEMGNIIYFYWSHPIKIVEVLTEHVDILTFDEVMLRLEEFSKIQFAFLKDYYSEGLMIKNIYDISLRLNYLPLKNNSSEFMIAPCWVFTYKEMVEYTEEQMKVREQLGFIEIGWDETGDNTLIISAVDGASVSGYSAKEYESYTSFDGEIG